MSALATIHVGKKSLGLSDAEYRDLLEAATGKRSSAEMTEAERQSVIAAMRARGFRMMAGNKTGKGGSARRDAMQRRPELAKVYALWGALEKTGTLSDPSLKALDKWIERQTGVAQAVWLKQAETQQVIEALKSWLNRVTRERP